MGFPLPINATFHDIKWDRFDIDEVPHEDISRLGADRCDADATIAHDDGSNAMPRRGCHQWVPCDLRIIMRMWINKSWREHQAVGINLLRCRLAVAFANRGYHPVFDCNIALKTRLACAVTDPSILNN